MICRLTTKTHVYQFQDSFKHKVDGKVDGMELRSSSPVVYDMRTKQLVDQTRLNVVFVFVCCCSCCQNKSISFLLTKLN